ncbi:MAG: PASTA domain-containing protein [Bacteroidales bacterium]|nr:PASTA domain-containing protein [Bacteroidales bacterium]MCF8457306.1 PASTA domain-containing protein [Bacteroidales bacterium]
MEILKFLISRQFLKHLLVALLIAIVLVAGSLWGLRIYTLHGKAYPVPGFKNISLDSAVAICHEQNLRYSIIDSVFVSGWPGGTIIEQYPDSGFFVKKNRTIYFTINAFEAEKVLMPDLIDLSFRKAITMLENIGLVVGTISYQPDLARDIVLRQMNNGVELPAGNLVSKGAMIDLVLGGGLSDEVTLVPMLVTLSLDSARLLASHTYLNIGGVIYDETIENAIDSARAKVFYQDPQSGQDSYIKLGSSIDLWMTIDTLKFLSDTINFDLSNSVKKVPIK